jgi:hypothetical protein
VDAPAVAPDVDQLADRLEEPPRFRRLEYPAATRDRRLVRTSVNYLEREARNASLGRAGEEFVVSFERARLRGMGLDALAERVEHVAVTVGDGAGFGVRSFDRDGSDRLIEVKTTAYGKQTPFFVSRNEVAFSHEMDDVFRLYRVFGFRRDPRLYSLRGALGRTCHLDPVQYTALPA